MKKNSEDKKFNYRNCDKCGLRWNVSPNILKRKKYICPRCFDKRR